MSHGKPTCERHIKPTLTRCKRPVEHKGLCSPSDTYPGDVTLVWRPTERVTCGDIEVTEYATDNQPVPVTAPHGKWTHMRGTDHNGVIRTVVRTAGGSGWRSA